MGQVVSISSRTAINVQDQAEIQEDSPRKWPAVVWRWILRPIVKVAHYLVFVILAMFAPIAQFILGGFAICAMLVFLFVMVTGWYHTLHPALVWGLPISSIISFSVALGWTLIVDWLGFSLLD